MQNLKLITKSTLVSWFGHSGVQRKHLQIEKLHFCTLATSQLGCTDLPSWQNPKMLGNAKLKSPECATSYTLPSLVFPDFDLRD